MRNAITIASLVGFLCLAGSALAEDWITEQPGHHANQTEAEFHAVVGDGDVGAGVRVSIPIVNQGFIPRLNDNVAISFGADVLNWPAPGYEVTGVIVPVMLQWNFFLTRHWSVFGEGGIAFQDWFSKRANGDDQTFFVWPGLGAGARYCFNPGNSTALVFRVGFPNLLSAGISF